LLFIGVEVASLPPQEVIRNTPTISITSNLCNLRNMTDPPYYFCLPHGYA
jgi:hypothetical protein